MTGQPAADRGDRTGGPRQGDRDKLPKHDPRPDPPAHRPPPHEGHWFHWHPTHHVWVYLPANTYSSLVLPADYALPASVLYYQEPEGCVCPHCGRPVRLVPG